MQLSDFDFELPEELIAQYPLPERDSSRMLVVCRKSGTLGHRSFRDLPDILGREHFLVANSTKVFPARLRAGRPGRDESIEVLLVREEEPRKWQALLKPARKCPIGQKLLVAGLPATVCEIRAEGTRVLFFDGSDDLMARFREQGQTPLPPYIRRSRNSTTREDGARYQTVYATRTGSVAAPTAGLHFTPSVLDRLSAGGIPFYRILLHVGYGTFQPVRTEEVEAHRMLPEYFEVSDDTAAQIEAGRAAGKRLVAVGTTTTRVLEFLSMRGQIVESKGFCDLFIYPGHEFRAVDGLLTNFHLPKSTLFMLVCAFAGRELMLESYREAIANNYRFFSYGDCMLIL